MANNEEIYQYLSGLDDDGSAISFNIETPESSVGTNFEDIIYPVEIEFEVKIGHNVELFVAYDNGNFKSIGRARRGANRIALDIDNATGDFPRCRMIRFACREMSKSECVIANLALLYYLSEDVEETRDNQG